MSVGWRRAGGRPAALLLEVVVALTIMVAALGIMAGQLVGGLRATWRADQQLRAAQLADRLLGLLELDPELTQRFFDERQSEGDFGPQHPGYFWRASVEPLSVDQPGLGLVTLEILHQPDPAQRDTIEGARLVRQLRLLKAEPGRIDLARDFGMDEQQISQLSELMPIPDFDPSAMDPQQLVSLDPQTLLELLPQLLPLLQQFIGARGAGREANRLGQLSDLLGGGPPGQGAGPPTELLGEAGRRPRAGRGPAAPESGAGAAPGALTIEDFQRLRDQASGGRRGRR